MAVDKSTKVASAALSLLGAIGSIRFKTSSEFETFKTVCFKAMDSNSGVVRLSAAKSMASVLHHLWLVDETKKREAETKAASAAATQRRRDDDDDDTGDKRDSPAPSSNKSGRSSTLHSHSFDDALSLLRAFYVLPSTSARARTAVAQTLAFYLLEFEVPYIEARYADIARVVLCDLLGSPRFKNDSHSILAARKHAYFILNDVISRQMLAEQAQLVAAKSLHSEILSHYPGDKDRSAAPTKNSLVGALQCISGLIDSLGSAVAAQAETLRQTLNKLLGHSSYAVKLAACDCLRRLAKAVPSIIVPELTHCLNYIQKLLPRDKTAPPPLNPQDADVLIGMAHAIAGLVSLTDQYPQHTSLDLTSRTLTLAIAALRGTAGNVYTVSSHVQAGWILVGGLMPLGPSFIKVHLSQLLLMWKTALGRPAGKEHSNERSVLEISYLLHVRYSALSCIRLFLAYNAKLVTGDVARRLLSMLQNVVSFVAGIPQKKYDEEGTPQLHRSLTLQAHEMLVRKRLLQCYLYLSKYAPSLGDAIPPQMLTSAMSAVSDPDQMAATKISSSVAAATGAAETLWDMTDNFAYGVTGKALGRDVSHDQEVPTHQLSDSSYKPNELPFLEKLAFESLLPVLGSVEFDPDYLLLDRAEGAVSLPRPLATTVVDLSIDFVASIIPLQQSKVQESLLEQLRSRVMAPVNGTTGPKVVRKSAVIINSIVCVYFVLQNSVSRSSGTVMKSDKPLKLLMDVIREVVVSADVTARLVAAKAMGMAAKLAGNTVATEHVKVLIDQIVANRDPNARSGYSLALAYILVNIGGMFAGLHLKTILGILTSLAHDPHPTVHYWALESLATICIDSGASFTGYASSTLSVLKKLYGAETHADEMASTASSNLDLEYPTWRVIARCVRSLVNALGPDLQENEKDLAAVLRFVHQFEVHSDESLAAEAHRNYQELVIFAPNHLDLKQYVSMIHRHLLLPYECSVRSLAAEGLLQLIKTKYGPSIFDFADASLRRDIWFALDVGSDVDALAGFVDVWLEQTAQTEQLQWISRVQAVLLKPRSFFNPISVAADVGAVTAALPDMSLEEEGASFAAKEEGDTADVSEQLRWQTRVVAVRLLQNLVRINLKGMTRAQRAANPIVSRIGDLVKLAFSASTAPVAQLRLSGLKLLNELLAHLYDLVDPDFKEVALLEQYQAQISSALTPAFSADSSPELAYEAIKVSATFIGTGIIKNVERMGRILRILTNALESCSSPHFTLGDLEIVSPNSRVMLRVATLSLWAELQVESLDGKHEYLVDVVRPHVRILVPQWISALRDYALLRFEPEPSQGHASSEGGVGSGMDQIYSAFARKHILPIYQQSWLQMVEAMASLIDEDSKLVFELLDEKERAANVEEQGINYSSEPAAFFFVLFGLCFEALVRPQQSFGNTSSDNQFKVLIAMRRIFHKSVSGNAIYKENIFAETVDVLDRILLTGDVREQIAVVAIARQLCLNHPGGQTESSPETQPETDEINESVDQLFELFRVVMLPLVNSLPFLTGDDENPQYRKTLDDSHGVTLVKGCVTSLVEMVDVFPKIIKIDLYACLLYIFGKLLEDLSSQTSIVPHTLPVHKKLLASMMATRAKYSEYAATIDDEILVAFRQLTTLLKDLTRANAPETVPQRRNVLLSAVIVATTCSDAIAGDRQSLVDLAASLVENITVPELSTVVAECTKTLLASTKNRGVLKVLTENTLPILVSLATNTEGKSLARHINDILVRFALTLDGGEQVKAALAIVVPSLVSYIEDNSVPEPAEERASIVATAVEALAAKDGASFRDVVQNGLSESQRAAVGRALRRPDTTSTQSSTTTAPETHIQLKSFGSSS